MWLHTEKENRSRVLVPVMGIISLIFIKKNCMLWILKERKGAT